MQAHARSQLRRVRGETREHFTFANGDFTQGTGGLYGWVLSDPTLSALSIVIGLIVGWIAATELAPELHRRAGRRIQPDEPTRRMLNAGLAADRPGVDVKLFDLTTELGVPVVFALARRRAEFGCMTCVGASARLAPRRALEKSVLEASQNFPYMRYLLQSQRAWQPAPDFSNVTTFEQHFLAYLKRPELTAEKFVPNPFA